jgi:beta-lactamase class A
MKRRALLRNLAAGAVVLGVRPAWSWATGADDPAARLAALEHHHGGKLGVAMLDTGSGRRVAHRGDERFQMCSTFKLLLVAAVLARVDGGQEEPDRRIVFGDDELLDYAPTARKHVGPPGMTIAQLAEAAITLSDNTAANLLLASVGGPRAVTAWVRGLGDGITRLDRIEPALNTPDGERDTTTPWAMLADMQTLLLGDALSGTSRERLTNWLLGCRTGLESLRAGLPAAWRVGDKTGQWDGHGIGMNNDIAIVRPPHRKPLLVTAYYKTGTTDVAARKAVLADVGRIAASL